MTKKVQHLVSRKLEQLNLEIATLVRTGFAFTLDQSLPQWKIGHLPTLLEEMTEGQRKDARRKESPWHVLLPLEGSSRHDRGLDSAGDKELPLVEEGGRGQRARRPRHRWRDIRP